MVLGFELQDTFSGFFGGSFSTMVTGIFATIAIALILGIFAYIIYDRKVYSKTINDFENISGQGYQLTSKDRARLIKTGDGGEELMWLKKRKAYRTAYGRKMGPNVYWFAKGQDGYFYNVLLGDLDAKMGMLDIEPVDRDMRYMHVAIRKNIDKRYDKVSWLDKYGTYLATGFFMIIMIIGIWFLLSQMAEISSGVAASIKTAQEVMVESKSVIASLDNICTGGSGIRPVGI